MQDPIRYIFIISSASRHCAVNILCLISSSLNCFFFNAEDNLLARAMILLSIPSHSLKIQLGQTSTAPFSGKSISQVPVLQSRLLKPEIHLFIYLFFPVAHYWLSPIRVRDKKRTSERPCAFKVGETQSALKIALTTVQRTLHSTHALKHSPQTDGSQWQRFCLFQSRCVDSEGPLQMEQQPINY